MSHRMTSRVPGSLRPALPVLPAAMLLMLLPLASGCAPSKGQEAEAEVPRNVRVMTLEPTTLTEYLEISGPVEPLRGTDVSAEETGTVAAIPNDKGERVQEGDVLIQLDRRLLSAELSAARSRLQLEQYNYEKTKDLFSAGKVSQQELLTSEADFGQARAQVDIAQRRWERAAVAAPFAGLVTERFVEPGQLVLPGMSVARVIDPYTLKLVGSLTEREVQWAQPGKPALAQLDGNPEPVGGEVFWVGFEADPQTGKFPIEIHLPNPDLALRAGVVGRARIPKQVHEGVLAVPRDAIVVSAQGPSVFVVEADTAAARPVELGPDQGVMVVVESGLQAGERLVVRGHRDLVVGSRVHITEVATAPDGSRPEDPDVVRSGSMALRKEG